MVGFSKVFSHGKNASIRRKLLNFVFWGVFCPFLLLIVYIIHSVSLVLIDNTYTACQSNLISVGANLTRLSNNMVNVAKYIGLDSEVLSFLKAAAHDGDMEIEVYNQLDKMLVNLQSQYLDQYFQIKIISDGVLRTSTGVTSVSGEQRKDFVRLVDYSGEEEYTLALQKPGANIWSISPLKNGSPPADVSSDYLTLSTAIIDYSSLNPVGVVYIEMSREQFAKKVFEPQSNIMFDCATILFNEKNEPILVSPAENFPQFDFEDASLSDIPHGDGPETLNYSGERYLISSYLDPTWNWRLVQIVSYKEILSHVRGLFYKIILIAVVAILCMGIYIFRFSDYLTDPMREIAQEMEKMRNGNYYVNIEPKARSFKEITILEDTFNNLVSTQRELLNTLAANEKQLIENQKQEDTLKLEMLISQINPHFLFNTLNVIKWTALMSNADNVANMLSNLGNILEMTFRYDRDFISIDEEIRIVKSYLVIYAMRLSSSIEIEYDIPEDLMDCQIPKFIIQPLVENAFLHAFPNQDNGTITISAHQIPEGLIISISDDGIGMQQEDIDKVMNGINLNNSHKKFSGVGIPNVHERIKLMCGEHYGLSIQKKDAGGLCMVLRLPLIRGTTGNGNDKSTDS